MSTILCIDDEPAVGASLEDALTRLGHRPVLAGSVNEGMAAVAAEIPDLIISDYRMPEATGLDLLDQLRQRGHDIPVIIMTGFASIEQAVLTIRHGAVDYLTKPLRAEALRIAVTNALEVTRLRRENEDFRREIRSLRGERVIIGESRALRAAMETVAAVAPTRATVLVQGESGTGKELIARAVHDQSPCREQLFVTVNCAALPEGLVESALFGHERGAFTGATARSLGAFERAHRGTLLLDEISEMRLDLQPKLLRAIQEQEIERVGGEQPIRVDTRIIATTNRDLRAEVEAGRFREDLFYRLHVVPIRTPPLRERLEDLPMLVEHFAAAAAARLGIRAPRVQAEAIEELKHRSWPGNIRELANVVERAVILDRTGSLTPGSFDPSHDRVAAPYAGGGGPPTAAVLAARPELALDLAELERLAIQRALLATGGHRAKAADLLGISERTLRNKLNTPPPRGRLGPPLTPRDRAAHPAARHRATPAMPAGALGNFCRERWGRGPAGRAAARLPLARTATRQTLPVQRIGSQRRQRSRPAELPVWALRRPGPSTERAEEFERGMENRMDPLSALTGLLRDELRLVGELRDALVRQRAGVANDDRAAVDASVDEIGRIAFTLEEARRRRAMLVGATIGDESFPLARFEAQLAGPLPEAFVRARADLQEAAQGAAIDVSINHAVLRRAVEAGGALLQRLFASTAVPPAIDGAADREGGIEGTPGRRTDRSA